jgi:small subunit ribosomal protein S6
VRQYELMMMLDPEADEERVGAVLDRVRNFVTERGGEFTEGEHWGKRKLAYKIGNFVEGHYLLAQLEMEPEPAKELEGTLKLTEDIIRHMLLRQDPSKDDDEESE